MGTQILLGVWVAAVGLVVGSFLNVVIHRVPRGASIVLPRSKCPWCNGVIRASDNIPVLSWLVLRGRCRHCSAPISGRYPAVEAFTALLFVACFEAFGPTPEAATAALFCCLMIVLAAIDSEHYLLPDAITFPGLALGLALQAWIPQATLVEAVTGALVGAGLLILLLNVWFWLRGEESMGLGDVNMLAMIGAFLGWQGVLTTMVLASFLGAVVGLGLIAARRMEMKSKLPFGVFLAAGGLVSLFFGPSLVDWYRQLL